MELVEQIKKIVIEKCEIYKKESIDQYDFFKEHIELVYKNAYKLGIEYQANMDIVLISSLLHDISLICKVGDKNNHHINSAKLAKKILIKYTSDAKKIESICNCIEHHRSSKNSNNIEELCVADADILSHFDNIAMLFNNAFTFNKVSLDKIDSYLKEILEKEFNDLSDKTKEIFKDRYFLICDILIK